MTQNQSPSRSSRFVRDVSITFAGNIALPLSTIISAPLLARGLGVEGRGEVAGAIAPTALALAIAALGLPEAITYFVAKHGQRGRTVFRGAVVMSALSGLAATVTVMILAPVLSGGNPDVESLIRGIALPYASTHRRSRARARQRGAALAPRRGREADHWHSSRLWSACPRPCRGADTPNGRRSTGRCPRSLGPSISGAFPTYRRLRWRDDQHEKHGTLRRSSVGGGSVRAPSRSYRSGAVDAIGDVRTRALRGRGEYQRDPACPDLCADSGPVLFRRTEAR